MSDWNNKWLLNVYYEIDSDEGIEESVIFYDMKIKIDRLIENLGRYDLSVINAKGNEPYCHGVLDSITKFKLEDVVFQDSYEARVIWFIYKPKLEDGKASTYNKIWNIIKESVGDLNLVAIGPIDKKNKAHVFQMYDEDGLDCGYFVDPDDEFNKYSIERLPSLVQLALSKHNYDNPLDVEIEDITSEFAGLQYSEAQKYNEEHDYVAAEYFYRKCIQIRSLLLGNDHQDTLMTIDGLVDALKMKGDYDIAEMFCRETLVSRKRTKGLNNYETLTNIFSLAYLLHLKGAYEEAESLYREASDISDKLGGIDQNSSVYWLGILLHHLGRHEEADACFVRDLDLGNKFYDPNNPKGAQCLVNFYEYFVESTSQPTELMLRLVIELTKRLNPKDLYLQTLRQKLGVLVRNKGRYDEAEQILKKVYYDCVKLNGKESLAAASSMSALGAVYQAKGMKQEAKDLYINALSIRETQLGSEDPQTRLIKDRLHIINN